MAEIKREKESEVNGLFSKIDFLINDKGSDDEERIKKTMDFYIREKKRLEMINQLKQGYMEMSEINLALAESGMEQDVENLSSYEDYLVGEQV